MSRRAVSARYRWKWAATLSRPRKERAGTTIIRHKRNSQFGGHGGVNAADSPKPTGENQTIQIAAAAKGRGHGQTETPEPIRPNPGGGASNSLEPSFHPAIFCTAASASSFAKSLRIVPGRDRNIRRTYHREVLPHLGHDLFQAGSSSQVFAALSKTLAVSQIIVTAFPAAANSRAQFEAVKAETAVCSQGRTTMPTPPSDAVGGRATGYFANRSTNCSVHRLETLLPFRFCAG